MYFSLQTSEVYEKLKTELARHDPLSRELQNFYTQNRDEIRKGAVMRRGMTRVTGLAIVRKYYNTFLNRDHIEGSYNIELKINQEKELNALMDSESQYTAAMVHAEVMKWNDLCNRFTRVNNEVCFICISYQNATNANSNDS